VFTPVGIYPSTEMPERSNGDEDCLYFSGETSSGKTSFQKKNHHYHLKLNIFFKTLLRKSKAMGFLTLPDCPPQLLLRPADRLVVESLMPQ